MKSLLKFFTPFVGTPLPPEHDAPRRIWKLDEPLHAYSDRFKKHIAVPRDFETDFSSIPQSLWFVATPEVGLEAAVVHDYLYSGMTNMTRLQADLVLFDGLRVLNYGLGWSIAVFLAVRLFGESHWGTRRHTR